MQEKESKQITEEKLQVHLEVSGTIASFLKKISWSSEKPSQEGYYWVKTSPTDEKIEGRLAYVFTSLNEGKKEKQEILCLTFINKASTGFHISYDKLKNNFEEVKFAGPLITPNSLFEE